MPPIIAMIQPSLVLVTGDLTGRFHLLVLPFSSFFLHLCPWLKQSSSTETFTISKLKFCFYCWRVSSVLERQSSMWGRLYSESPRLADDVNELLLFFMLFCLFGHMLDDLLWRWKPLWSAVLDHADAKNKDGTTTQQYEEDWIRYQDVMNRISKESGIGPEKFYDLRGNHDKYGVPYANSSLDYYSRYSWNARQARTGLVQSILLLVRTSLSQLALFPSPLMGKVNLPFDFYPQRLNFPLFGCKL